MDAPSRVQTDSQSLVTDSIAILGRGFGLYGYAVAAHELEMKVVTLRRYKSEFLGRSDLAPLLNEVDFVNSDGELIDRSPEAIVYARRPQSQVDFIRDNWGKSRVHWFLEKPLTPLYSQRRGVRQMLAERNGTYSVSYLFAHTPWFRMLKTIWERSQPGWLLDFTWHLPQIAQNEALDSWKMSPVQGGGLIQYYAVHFSPVINELGISLIGVEQIRNQLKIHGYMDERRTFRAQVGSGPSRFTVKVTNESGRQHWFHQEDTPFGSFNLMDPVDLRVPIIKRYLAVSLGNPQQAMLRADDHENGAEALLSFQQST